MMRRELCIALTLLLSAGVCGAQEKHTLTPAYAPGDYVTTMESQMEQTIEVAPGQTMPQKVDILMVMEMDVQPKTAEGQEMTVTYKRVRHQVTSPIMTMGYDTIVGAIGQDMGMGAMFQAMIDKPLRVKLGPDGNVVSISGQDEMFQAMAQASPMVAPMIEQMKDQFGEGMLKQMLGMSRMYLPAQPVAVGETWPWQSTLDVPMVGQMEISGTSTLKEVKSADAGQVAMIGFESKMETAPSTQPAATVEGMSLHSMSQKQSGTMEFDMSSGMAKRADSVMDMQMELSQGEGGGKMKISQTGKVTHTTTAGNYVAPETQAVAPAAPAAPAAPMAPMAPVAPEAPAEE